jgi:hypothetical protein
MTRQIVGTKITAHNSTYPKGGVSFSKDSFAVHQTIVFTSSFPSKTHPSPIPQNSEQRSAKPTDTT